VFAQEALIHLLVAAPIPVLGLLAARRLTGRARRVTVGLSLLFFVVLFPASYFFFCTGCN